MTFGVLLTLLSIALHIYPIFSDNTDPEYIKQWCSQTPNHQLCEYFMAQNPNSHVIKDNKDFKKLAIQIALDRALQAKTHTLSLGPKCRDEREKAAWADCVELYETTILQLNQTIDPYNDCTNFDQQTWLSAALTNLETCQIGFMEFGVTNFILPLLSNNVSKLICNTLAINNKHTPSDEEKYKDGLPTWTTAGDRKLLQSSSPAANLVVAQDGSGDFKTIQQAVGAVSSRRKGSGRFVIYVKAGTYKENVEVGKKLNNIMFIGDGKGKTIVTGSRSVKGGSTTFNSATVVISGERFIARDMTFVNTAGSSNGQAVALRSGADLSVFYRCSFEAYQDTLYVHSQRQFYKECDIYGTVDFIFGNAAVVFQNCNIYARKPNNGQSITITAQGRSDPNQNTGISIHNSRVLADSDLPSSVKTYLGRPWREYSRTVFLQTFLDRLVDPAGWLEWNSKSSLNRLYYGEYKNTGPGSSTSNRVKWGGYRVITSATEASRFNVANFLSGNSWLPSTNVPFTSGL